MAAKRRTAFDSSDALRRARLFLQTNARLLERRRFAYFFEGGSSTSVVRALQAYQNDDGGFGNAFEPDLRGAESEPIPAWGALGVLDEVRAMRGPVLAGLLRYVRSAGVWGGGIPFVLPAARASPHAPWWETPPGPVRGALNPTAGIAAYLYKHRIRTPWLTEAAPWCWARIDSLDAVNPYELRVVLAFLDRTPERSRAEATLQRLRPLVRRPDVVVLEGQAEAGGFRPLDYSPEPGLRSRTLFTNEEIEDHLDRIVRTQRPDGGWPIDFPVWTPITRFEWEGCQTVEMLKVLAANGRLPVPRRTARSVTGTGAGRAVRGRAGTR
jgi:hypothetical protein